MRASWQVSAFKGAYFRAEAGGGLLVGTDICPRGDACHMWSPESLGSVPAQGGAVTFNDLGITATAGRLFFQRND